MYAQRKNHTQTLTLGAILTALIFVLQFLVAPVIKLAFPFLPFTISLVLIPIVIGAAKCGPYMGGWLGFVFGFVVLISGDAAAFLAISVGGTIATVLIKGTACGLVAGLVYKCFEKWNQYVAVAVASVVCPIVNTGIFFLGCILFFWDTIAAWAQGAGFGDNVATYMFLGLAGINFLVEFGTNLILNPAIVRLLNIKKK